MHNNKEESIMAKETKVKEYKEEAEKLNKPTNADALNNLKEQLTAYQKQAAYYHEMVLKAQGAIEVLTQLEKDDESEGNGGTGSTASSD
jgi:hypothetical protein